MVLRWGVVLVLVIGVLGCRSRGTAVCPMNAQMTNDETGHKQSSTTFLCVGMPVRAVQCTESVPGSYGTAPLNCSCVTNGTVTRYFDPTTEDRSALMPYNGSRGMDHRRLARVAAERCGFTDVFLP